MSAVRQCIFCCRTSSEDSFPTRCPDPHLRLTSSCCTQSIGIECCFRLHNRWQCRVNGCYVQHPERDTSFLRRNSGRQDWDPHYVSGFQCAAVWGCCVSVIWTFNRVDLGDGKCFRCFRSCLPHALSLQIEISQFTHLLPLS